MTFVDVYLIQTSLKTADMNVVCFKNDLQINNESDTKRGIFCNRVMCKQQLHAEALPLAMLLFLRHTKPNRWLRSVGY